MAKESFEIYKTFPKDAQHLYNAWLNSEEHTAFTGGSAEIKPEVGSKFSAWDGYITGTLLELEEGKRIVHSWRTSEFAEEEEDSILEVKFSDILYGARVDIIHSNLGKGQGEKYKKGWVEHYFQPMTEYFGEL